MSVVKVLVSAGFLIILVLTSSAHARSVVPIINHDTVPVSSSSGSKITLSQVRQAFIIGGAKDGWIFSDLGENQMIGRLVVRNKHTVAVTIRYDVKSYSVEYKDSSNMKYELKVDSAYIHPFYNKWVDNLIFNVNIELSHI